MYSALDAEFAEPILEQYAREHAVDVRPNFDVESTKTVGLVTRIQQERSHPRCDVFWNNEILHTLRLEKQGLLEAYASPAAAEFPENYRSPQGYWHGFAARARVLIVNTRAGGGERASAIDRGPGGPEVAGASGHRQTVVRHDGHACQCPVRLLGRSSGPRRSFAN